MYRSVELLMIDVAHFLVHLYALDIHYSVFNYYNRSFDNPCQYLSYFQNIFIHELRNSVAYVFGNMHLSYKMMC